MLQVVVVAAGGAAGAVARYLISIWAAARFGPDFPYGTLLVNISGCFMIGMVMTVATERVSLQPYWQLLLGVGFIGGLTTFSAFSLETLRLMQTAAFGPAVANIGVNLLAGLTATWLGIAVVRLF
ncbi:MAG: fluoride efflux transporter CrcB [Sporomusaceae bacterium]|nr:fluoride efflux transporter CrcB [Sporomusaceae bacterium]